MEVKEIYVKKEQKYNNFYDAAADDVSVHFICPDQASLIWYNVL